MENLSKMFAEYYKAERRKGEDCLGDILKILQENVDNEAAINAIIERLIKHYDR